MYELCYNSKGFLYIPVMFLTKSGKNGRILQGETV